MKSVSLCGCYLLDLNRDLMYAYFSCRIHFCNKSAIFLIQNWLTPIFGCHSCLFLVFVVFFFSRPPPPFTLLLRGAMLPMQKMKARVVRLQKDECVFALSLRQSRRWLCFAHRQRFCLLVSDFSFRFTSYSPNSLPM